MSTSQVSKFLQSSLSTEIQELISIPRLKRELVPGFPAMLQSSAAHLVMLEASGLVERAAATDIARALLRMREEGPEAINPDPLLEDAYFNFEARLMQIAGQNGGLLHVGRSRNDLGATSERMRVRELVLNALDHASSLLDVLAERGEEGAHTVMTGYTHLQPAQPITFGYYLTGLGSALLRDVERLRQSYARINLCPLGAGALAGTSFRLDRDMTAKLLGFDGLLVHNLDAVASRDFALEVLGALAGTATTLSRMATDLYAFSTQEFGLISFPDSVAGTSSIMPQKKNLAFIEHLRAKPAHVLAGYVSMLSSIKNSHFTNTMDGNREAMRLFWDAAEEGVLSLRLARLSAANALPQADIMLERAKDNFSCVTDLADLLVKENGLSFRAAHHVVGAVVHEAFSRQISPRDIDAKLVEKCLREVAGVPMLVDANAVAACLDPVMSVQKKTLPGGPAPSQVLEMSKDLKDQVADLRTWLAKKQQALSQAATRVDEGLTALAS